MKIVKFNEFININEMVINSDNVVDSLFGFMQYSLIKKEKDKYIYYKNNNKLLNLLITNFNLGDFIKEDFKEKLSNGEYKIYLDKNFDNIKFVEFQKFMNEPDKLSKKRFQEIGNILMDELNEN